MADNEALAPTEDAVRADWRAIPRRLQVPRSAPATPWWRQHRVRASWGRPGFTVIDDEAFFRLVAARLVVPTSKRDSIRVIGQLGVQAFHENTYYAALRRCMAGNYGEQIAKACFTYVWTDAGR